MQATEYQHVTVMKQAFLLRGETGGSDAAVKSSGAEEVNALGQRALTDTWVTNSNTVWEGRVHKGMSWA